MQLQLLDFEKYINANKVLQVKSYKIPSQTYDEDGLWSESIFGKIGSRDRLSKFGYIDLKKDFIHPSLYDMIATVSEQTSKIIRNKEFYIVEDEKYKSDPHGKTGIEFLISSIKDVKFSKFCHKHKKEIAKYLDKTDITINKFLVQPAGLRDIDIYNKQAMRNIDEINNYYTKLLIYIEQLTGVEDLDDITSKKIQMQLNDIYKYFQDNRLKGKKGLFRGTMLTKTMDYSTRLVLTNDPDVPLGYIGMPWHTLSSIFEPFMIYYLFKADSENKDENIEILRNYTGNNKLDSNSFPKFNREITNNPDIIPNEVKNVIVDTLNIFLDDQVVMVKRDPVQQRNSWFSAIPMIMEGRVAFVNSLDLGPIQGDCVKGNVILFKKNDKGEITYQYSIPIDEFHKFHKVKLISSRKVTHTDSNDEIEIHEFKVLDDVYSIGLDEKTKLFKHCKIMNWSIHNNINTCRMTVLGEDVIISETRSCFVLDTNDNIYKKLSVSDIKKEPERYKFIYANLKNIDVKFIPADEISFIKYTNTTEVNINIPEFNIDIKTPNCKIAYDFTIEDEHVRSFLHESMVLQCNSDGDTVAILPVFSKEAKEEVKYKMNPKYNKNKWNSPLSYNDIIYSPTLDTIATIYNATRE